MSKEVAILVKCDLCGARREEQPVTEDVPIRNGRQERELDLCDQCKARLDEIMAPFMEVGRKPGKSAAPRKAIPSDAEKTEVCSECEKKFTSPQGLAVHRSRSHGIRGSQHRGPARGRRPAKKTTAKKTAAQREAPAA